jgi:hypothetical protein
MVDFDALKALYKAQMDMVLASTGLATQVNFNFTGTKRTICPNCIYDPNLKRSSNKYKSGGPIPFTTNQICPYCGGAGFYGEESSTNGYLAIVWDYKKWINAPPNLASPEGMIQTICDITYLPDILKCATMQAVYPSSNNEYHKFELYGEPNPAGLGDNNYLFCMWKKVN